MVFRQVICTGLLWLVVTASSRTGSNNRGKNGREAPGRLAAMKLGLQLGYWGAQPPTNHAELVAAAEEAELRHRLHRRGVGLGRLHAAGVVGPRDHAHAAGHVGAPAVRAHARPRCAMAALTLDHLSGGRHIVGLGVSGPQVVEGWYGAKFPKPLARTREYVDILRQVWAREAPVHSDGPHYPLPLTGEGTTGPRQEPQADHPPAARRHPGHAGRRGSEERRAGRRDLRRLAADLLLAAHRGHVQRVARRGLRPPRRPAHPRDLRDLRDGAGRGHRRPRRRSWS